MFDDSRLVESVIYKLGRLIKVDPNKWNSEAPPVIDKDLIKLLGIFSMKVKSEPTLLELQPPLKVVSDIHGQFMDLLRILNHCGSPGQARYLFLGDFVDRGPHGVEVFAFLAALKCKYPDAFWLLRGNHESGRLNMRYGFQEEIKRKYSPWVPVWDAFMRAFSYLPIAALIGKKLVKTANSSSSLIDKGKKRAALKATSVKSKKTANNEDDENEREDDEEDKESKNKEKKKEEIEKLPKTVVMAKSPRIFAMHGGLSPELTDFNQIKQLKRPFDIPAYGLSCDLVWSDPDEDHKGWSQNTRNLSFTFGNDIVLDFCRQMNVAMIVRGHQVPCDMETKYKKSKSIPRRGYKFFAGSRLLTLFSVPNYMGMAKNEARSHFRYFGNLSQETKTRYKKELELWKAHFRQMGRKKIPRIRKRPKQDPTLPRRSMTPYMHYFKEQMPDYRSKHPKSKYIDIVKALGRQWRGLSQRVKVPYVEQARASLHQYRETMKQWKLEKHQSKNILRIEKKSARLKMLREKYMKKVENVPGGKATDATIAAVEEKRLGGI